MLLTIVGILIILWLVGFIAHVGGALIHLVLLAAVIVFIYHLLTDRHAKV